MNETRRTARSPSREFLSAPPVYFVDDGGHRWRVLDVTRRAFALQAARSHRFELWPEDERRLVFLDPPHPRAMQRMYVRADRLAKSLGFHAFPEARTSVAPEILAAHFRSAPATTAYMSAPIALPRNGGGFTSGDGRGN